MARFIEHLIGYRMPTAHGVSEAKRDALPSARPVVGSLPITTRSRNGLGEAPFDFDQIDKLLASDSYATQAFMRILELMWKEGYEIKSADDEALAYIERRLRALGVAQRQSFERFLQEASSELVRYHNCFIVKARDRKVASALGIKAHGVFGKDPVVAYFIVPTKSIVIEQDEQGNVKRYIQRTGGSSKDERSFSPEDVIHIRHLRVPGTQWGFPYLDAAIEDVRSFRLVEEDMLNIIHSELYPLIHYRVKGAKPEWSVTDDEINAAYQELMKMKDGGAIVTDGADVIEKVRVADSSLDADPYISHFKERAIVGLGVAPHQIGVLQTSIAGETARQLDVALYDKIKLYQDILEDAVVNGIFFELLLEGGFDPIGLNGEPTVVRFEFREIDVDAQIKRENHAGVMWVQNMLTHDEMRQSIGKRVDAELAGAYHKDVVEIPLAQATGRMTGPAGGDNPRSPAKGPGGSMNDPANQHGRRGGPKMKA